MSKPAQRGTAGTRHFSKSAPVQGEAEAPSISLRGQEPTYLKELKRTAMMAGVGFVTLAVGGTMYLNRPAPAPQRIEQAEVTRSGTAVETADEEYERRQREKRMAMGLPVTTPVQSSPAWVTDTPVPAHAGNNDAQADTVAHADAPAQPSPTVVAVAAGIPTPPSDMPQTSTVDKPAAVSAAAPASPPVASVAPAPRAFTPPSAAVKTQPTTKTDKPLPVVATVTPEPKRPVIAAAAPASDRPSAWMKPTAEVSPRAMSASAPPDHPVSPVAELASTMAKPVPVPMAVAAATAPVVSPVTEAPTVAQKPAIEPTPRAAPAATRTTVSAALPPAADAMPQIRPVAASAVSAPTTALARRPPPSDTQPAAAAATPARGPTRVASLQPTPIAPPRVDEARALDTPAPAASASPAATPAAVPPQQSAWRTLMTSVSTGLSAMLTPSAPRDPSMTGIQDCADCPQLVMVPAGYFHSAIHVAAGYDSAGRRTQQSRTRIDRFALAKTAVTVGSYEKFLTATGHTRPACEGALAGDRSRPVTCVSFVDAHAYAAWLRGQSGMGFRLPSAAEWEYAARRSSGDETAIPSATAGLVSDFGLESMGGGVAEIVADCWLGAGVAMPTDGSAARVDGGCKSRLLMGTAADERAAAGKPAVRRDIEARAVRADVGFRLARDVTGDGRN